MCFIEVCQVPEAWKRDVYIRNIATVNKEARPRDPQGGWRCLLTLWSVVLVPGVGDRGLLHCGQVLSCDSARAIC